MPLRFSRAPVATSPEREAFLSAPSNIASLTAATLAPGILAKARAAAPATCGLAMEVPEGLANSLPAEYVTRLQRTATSSM